VVKIVSGQTDDTQRQAAVTRGASHSGLVKVLRIEQLDDGPMVVREYVSGVSCGDLLGRNGKRLPVDCCLFVASEMCRAVGYLHALGTPTVIHGRLRPEKVLLSWRGRVKISGSELAGPPELAGRRVREAGEDEGFAPPEAFGGSAPLCAASDVYGIGATLWSLLVGRRPEGASRPPGAGTDRADGGAKELPPPSSMNPELDGEVGEALDRIIRSACHPSQKERIASAAALGRKLSKLGPTGAKGAQRLARWLGESLDGLADDESKRMDAVHELWKERFGSDEGNGRAEAARMSDSSAGVALTRKESPKQVEGSSDKQSSLPPSQLVGTVLDDRYRIEGLIGEGGMGEVYAGEHVQIGRRVAIKVLHPLYSNEEEVVERFRREARAATAIGHPNIVDVTDSGTTPDGRAFFVMEQLDGVELADVIIEDGWLDPNRATRIAIQVCRGVGAAHKAGIIHRDLKPENIFLVNRDGEIDFVKILDFGIAKSTRMEMTRGGGLTQPGLAMGTPEYMSPEQAAGKVADGRVDVYSAGGLLYAMLTGRPPHQGSNVMEILTLKATKPPKPVREIRPEVPEELEKLCLQALARNPDDRPQSMEQLEYELRKFSTGRSGAVAAMLGLRPTEDSSGLIDLSSITGPNAAHRGSASSSSGMSAVDAPAEGPKASRAAITRDADPPPRQLGEARAATLDGTWRMGQAEDFVGDEMDRVTVVRRPSRGLGWLWIVLALVGLAGVVTGFVLLESRKEGQRRKKVEQNVAAEIDSGADDASLLDGGVVDGGQPEPDAEPVDAAPSQLTEDEIDTLLSAAWKAAGAKRWTKPASGSLLDALSKLDDADTKRVKTQVAKLRMYARRKLLAKTRKQTRRRAWKDAEATLRDLMALLPGNAEVKRKLVWVLTKRAKKALAKDKVDLAEALSGEAVTLDATYWQGRLTWAEALAKTGKEKRALQQYEKIVAAKQAPRRIRRRARRAKRRLEKKVGDQQKEARKTPR
jgi:serine/threonine protein kinase